ncbi:hypothetical protein BCL90_2658 [Pedobacter alluvionis]|uniref:Uncharacterized protein n=2 Tax=Pedobacter alluvionis TaxID=475253 RepID=A0A497Y4W4_9SPHI|nr:hypothetical protein BCL90_2658 [Pedobacter alluvionis]TFB33226.1 hypothetical protein E3V97_04055 [Pedobacter alluvionis]
MKLIRNGFLVLLAILACGYYAVGQTYNDAVPISFAAGIKPLENYETLSGSSKGRAELLSHNALQDSAGIKNQLARTFTLH